MEFNAFLPGVIKDGKSQSNWASKWENHRTKSGIFQPVMLPEGRGIIWPLKIVYQDFSLRIQLMQPFQAVTFGHGSFSSTLYLDSILMLSEYEQMSVRVSCCITSLPMYSTYHERSASKQ